MFGVSFAFPPINCGPNSPAVSAHEVSGGWHVVHLQVAVQGDNGVPGQVERQRQTGGRRDDEGRVNDGESASLLEVPASLDLAQDLLQAREG